MITVQRPSQYDSARVRRRVAGGRIRQCRNRQIFVVGSGADAKNPVHGQSDPVIESDHRRSCARGGGQGFGGDPAVVAKIHAFHDRSRRSGGIDAGGQSQHRQRADTPCFTGRSVADIENDHCGAVVEVVVPIGDVNNTIVRERGDVEGIVIHRHGDVRRIDIESARCIRRGRMVQGQRAIKR